MKFIIILSLILIFLQLQASENFKSDCIAKKPYACANHARNEIYEYRKAKLKVFLKEQCSKKNLWACRDLAIIVLAEGSFKEYQKILGESCKNNYEEPCFYWTSEVEAGTDKSKQNDLLKKLCDNGSLLGCVGYANNLYNKNEKKQIEIYKMACSKLNASACSSLQSHYAVQKMSAEEESARIDFLKASKIECDNGMFISCIMGTIYNKNIAENRIELKRLCNLHIDSACSGLANLERELGNKDLSKKAWSENEKINSIACDQGDGDSCHYMASFYYYTNLNLKKNKAYSKKTRLIFNRGCDDGYNNFCSALKLSSLNQ